VIAGGMAGAVHAPSGAIRPKPCATCLHHLRDAAVGPTFLDLEWEVMAEGVNVLQLNNSCRKHSLSLVGAVSSGVH
jgi:hypothetical protein